MDEDGVPEDRGVVDGGSVVEERSRSDGVVGVGGDNGPPVPVSGSGLVSGEVGGLSGSYFGGVSWETSGSGGLMVPGWGGGLMAPGWGGGLAPGRSGGLVPGSGGLMVPGRGWSGGREGGSSTGSKGEVVGLLCLNLRGVLDWEWSAGGVIAWGEGKGAVPLASVVCGGWVVGWGRVVGGGWVVGWSWVVGWCRVVAACVVWVVPGWVVAAVILVGLV